MIILFLIVNFSKLTFASSIYKLNKRDLKAANNIDTLTKLIDSDSYSSYVIKKTYQRIKRSKSFQIYTPWIKKIKQINDSKYPKTYTYCRRQDKKINFLGPFLKSYIDKVCDHKIINQLRILKKPVINIRYVKENLDRLKNRTHFLSSLFQIERRNKKIKTIIEDYIYKQSQFPIKLIKNHNNSSKLTKHLQEKGFSKQLNSYLENYSLSQQIRSFYRDYDELNDNYEDHLEEILNYARKSNSYGNLTGATKMLSLGRYLLRRKETKISRVIFKNISTINNSELKEKAQFNLLWSYINKLEYSKALDVFKTEYPEYKVEKVKSSRLKFWLTYSMYSEGQKDQSIEQFKKLITKSPLSYYSIISSKLLRREIEPKQYTSFIDKFYKPYLNVVSILPKRLSKEARDAFKRITAWSRIDQKKFLSSEISSLFKNIKDMTSKKYPKALAKQDAVLLVSEILNKNDQHISAFSNLYRAISSNTVELNTFVLKKLFPLPRYTNFIFNFKDIDPVIVISLIRQESGFNSEAISPVGARGLMQLMPNTAKRFNRRVSIKDLENPKKNIKIGVTYLKHLLNLYDNNLVYALSAYNAGEGRVKRWRDRFLVHESILHNIENIPFDETKKYVKLIFRNIFFYKLIKEKKMFKDGYSMNKFFDVSLGFKH